MKFLEGSAVERAIRELAAKHKELHWAVAWGSLDTHGRALLEHKSKFRFVTFGVAFSQTHPDLVDALEEVSHARVATRFHGGTFHPKVYLFRSRRDAAAIVGSANFTRGAFNTNREAAVRIDGQADDPFFKDLLRFVRESYGFGEAVTATYARLYRMSWARAARLKKAPRDPVPGRSDAHFRQLTSPVLEMSWARYAAQVRDSAEHDVEQSLKLLRTARSWFANESSFRRFTPPQRKAIAGVIGNSEKDDPELGLDWGWFGSMQGAGDFKNRIKDNDLYLAAAVDGIPLQGEVGREDFERFTSNFVRAFRDSHRTGRVATASRLLAIKRPDVFLCVCGPNIGKASEQLGFPKSTLTLENYWERVVEVIRSADWYNVPRPTTRRDGELWDGRAAMLDAIFYSAR